MTAPKLFPALVPVALFAAKVAIKVTPKVTKALVKDKTAKTKQLASRTASAARGWAKKGARQAEDGPVFNPEAIFARLHLAYDRLGPRAKGCLNQLFKLSEKATLNAKQYAIFCLYGAGLLPVRDLPKKLPPAT